MNEEMIELFNESVKQYDKIRRQQTMLNAWTFANSLVLFAMAYALVIAV